jgi:hypothetical protein
MIVTLQQILILSFKLMRGISVIIEHVSIQNHYPSCIFRCARPSDLVSSTTILDDGQDAHHDMCIFHWLLPCYNPNPRFIRNWFLLIERKPRNVCEQERKLNQKAAEISPGKPPFEFEIFILVYCVICLQKCE